MKTIYCIIAMCLSLCFVISCGGDTNDGNNGDFELNAMPLNEIFAEVISSYDDYLIAIVTAGDDNFSQDDQINIYFDVYSSMPCIEAIQVGDTINVLYSDNAFSKADGVFSINAYAIGIVQYQDGDVVFISLLSYIKLEVVTIYNDYLIAIATDGDDNFSQDDKINIYYSEVYIPDIEAGDTILVSYCINAFSKTDGVFSINAYAIGSVQEQ